MQSGLLPFFCAQTDLYLTTGVELTHDLTMTDTIYESPIISETPIPWLIILGQ